MDYTFWLKIAGAFSCFVLLNTLLCGWARNSTRKFSAFNWLLDHKPLSYIFSLGHTSEEIEETACHHPVMNPDEQGIFWGVVIVSLEAIGILILTSLFAPLTWPTIIWGIILEPKAPPFRPSTA